LLPLLIELGLLAALLMTLAEIDQDRKVESTTIHTLQSINLVLNGVAQCGNFLIFKAPSTDQLLSIDMVWERMKEDQKALKRYVLEEKIKSKRTGDLIAAVDKLITVSDSWGEEVDFNKELKRDYSGVLGKALSPLSAEIASTGALAMKEQLQRRKRITVRMNAHEARMEEIIHVGTMTAVAVAVLLALYLFMRLWLGMRVLMNNTTNIALGRELLPPMRGHDELARLDKLIHSLSDDLNKLREKERALLDNTSVIICSCEETLRIIEINHVVEALLGFTPSEMTGGILSSFVQNEDRDKVVENLEGCIAVPGTVTFEARLKRRTTGSIITEVTAEWSKSNRQYFLTFQDISERKKFERQKAEVMEIISSDLRSPLEFILHNLETLSSGAFGQFTERGLRLAKNSTLSVKALMSLVGDLVDMERFESDSLTLSYSKTTAADLLHRSLDMVKAGADKKKLTISVEAKDAVSGNDIALEADADRIIRVIVNLLGNAIKFSPDGSAIELSCIREQGQKPSEGNSNLGGTSGNTTLYFAVKDQGPGIPQEKLGVVFEKFKQAGLDTKEEKSGSGLGLAICRAIVEAHGGTIGVDSVYEQGSTFWFRIPSSKNEDANK